MNLDEAQKQKVAAWLEAGLKLGEIQNKLISELGLKLTYMEVRFLLDDLKLKPKEQAAPAAPPQSPLTSAAKSAAPVQPQVGKTAPPATMSPNDAPGGSAGKVSVTVDQVTRPGTMVSGGVTFSDGNTAQWHLDQFGRLGLAAKQQGYRPAEEDLMEFQASLQSELAKLGI